MIVLLVFAIIVVLGFASLGAVFITWLLLAAWEARKARQRKAVNWKMKL